MSNCVLYILFPYCHIVCHMLDMTDRSCLYTTKPDSTPETGTTASIQLCYLQLYPVEGGLHYRECALYHDWTSTLAVGTIVQSAANADSPHRISGTIVYIVRVAHTPLVEH